MKNMTHVVTEASIMLGDSGNSIWTAAELQRYCKVAYRLLMRETRMLFEQAYVNDQAAVSDYKIPTNAFEIIRATWNAKPLRLLSEGRVQEKDGRYQEDDRTGSEPYAIFGSGVDTFRKWPVPAESASNSGPSYPTTDVVNNTRVEFHSYGPDLDSSPFELPEYMVRSIRHYILWKAYAKKGKGSNKALAKHYMQRWGIDLELYIKRVRTVGSVRVGTVGGARRMKRRGPASPRLPWEYGRIVRG